MALPVPSVCVVMLACKVCVVSLVPQAPKASRVKREKKAAPAHVDNRAFLEPRVALVRVVQEAPVAVAPLALKVLKAFKAPRVTRVHLALALVAQQVPWEEKVSVANLAEMAPREMLVLLARKVLQVRMASRAIVATLVQWVALDFVVRQETKASKDPRATRDMLAPRVTRATWACVVPREPLDKLASKARTAKMVQEAPSVVVGAVV